MKVLRISSLHGLIVDSEVTDVYSSVGSSYFVKCETGTLNTFVHDLEKLALLWIHIGRF